MVLVVDVLELVLAYGDDVAMLESMFLDQLPVDEGSVGAVQILKEGIVEYRDNGRMLAADRQVIHLNVIFRLAANEQAFLVERKL